MWVCVGECVVGDTHTHNILHQPLSWQNKTKVKSHNHKPTHTHMHTQVQRVNQPHTRQTPMVFAWGWALPTRTHSHSLTHPPHLLAQAAQGRMAARHPKDLHQKAAAGVLSGVEGHLCQEAVVFLAWIACVCCWERVGGENSKNVWVS